jgi:uncharacterized protein (DUF427 family)
LKKLLIPRLPLPKVRHVHRHVAVVLGDVVLAETRSAKILMDRYFFPLCDVKVEYLTPARLRPPRDEIGDSQYISIEVAGKVVSETGARFYYHPRHPYRVLKEHITFDPSMIDAYYRDSRRKGAWLCLSLKLASSRGNEENLAA